MKMTAGIEADLIEKTRDLFSREPFSDVLAGMLKHCGELYLVGGAVRDLALGREIKDLDFLVPSDGIEIARSVANALGAAFYPLDEERDVGRVILRSSSLLIDVASMRRRLRDDLLGRDFTINAIAVELSSWPDLNVIDIAGGLRHLSEGKIVAVSNRTFTADPVRVLRLVRFIATLGFRSDESTWNLAKGSSSNLVEVSAERIRDELVRIVDAPGLAESLRRLDDLGALQPVLPEMEDLKGVRQPPPHVDDVYHHTLSVVSHTERIVHLIEGGDPLDEPEGLLVAELREYFPEMKEHFSSRVSGERNARCCLKLASIAHDWGKPKTYSEEDGRIHFFGHETVGAEMAQERLRLLAFSRAETNWVVKAVRLHMRIHDIAHSNPVSKRAIFRFVREAGEMTPSLVVLNLADHRGTHQAKLDIERWQERLSLVDRILEFYYKRLGERLPKPILSGSEIIERWKIHPGPTIGKLLRGLQEAQAMGEVSTREEAVEWVNDRLRSDYFGEDTTQD